MSKAHITGIAGRFPKSNNLHEFWENLINGVDMLGPTRWPPGLYGLPPRSGSIPDLGTFDAEYFGYAENEARNSNLLQRVLLEVIYEGVVDSGFTLASLRADRTGLYLACTFSDGDVIATSSVQDSSNSNLRSSLLQRLLAWYRFQGPVMSVDTACSSSLSALQMAVTDLNAGRCNYAVVAGINLIVSPNCSQCFNQLKMLSPTGDSHVFDVSANGYVRSDGVGVIILTTIPDRCARIYASITDIAVNCDGWKEENILFPSRSSQCKLLRSLYGDELIPTSSLAYVEAHGTGTQTGDCLELNALLDALCEGREEPLPVGSVKSNIGHCEAAAGLAGLIKCILSFHHGVLPANLHYKSPNTGIEGIPLGKIKVVDTLQPLTGRINVIGVNSFGFGGVNGHVVLMSYKNPRDAGEDDGGTFLVPLTVRSPAGVERVQDFLEKHADDVDVLRLMSKSMLSCDTSQGVRAYATVRVKKKLTVRPIVEYTIRVTTGDRIGAGTDANVFIEMQGDLGKAGRYELKESTSSKDKYERGHTDEFQLEIKDIGHLKRIKIGHDDKGLASPWFLDHVTVHSSALQHTWTVPCGRWLARDEDDGQIVRELFPLESSITQEKRNVTVCWSHLLRSPPPLWLLVRDGVWCNKPPHSDLLHLEEFRKSIQESDKVLLSLSSDISVEEMIKDGADIKQASKLGLVCATVVLLGIIDVLEASKVSLNGFLGSGLSEIIVAHLDGCLTLHQCLEVTLAVGDALEDTETDRNEYTTYAVSLHPELAYKLGPKTRILSYVGDNKILAAIPTHLKDHILRMLQQTGGVYTEVEKRASIYTKLEDKLVRRLEQKLRTIIPAPKKRSDKFRSCSDSNSRLDPRRQFGPSYIIDLVQTTVKQFQTVSNLPKGSTVLSLCMSGNCAEHEVNTSLCDLSEIHCHPKVESLLQSLGEIHLQGHEIDVDHLYRHLPLPVDCSTPPLSPLVEWDHNIKWPLPDWCQFSARVKDIPRELYGISMADMNGAVYDPLALLLYHAWCAVSGTPGNLQPIILSSFTTNPELMTPDYLHGACVYVQQGRKFFSILTTGGIVMTGNYDHPDDSVEIPLVPGYDVDVNENVAKTQDDCETEVETQEVLWEDSWLDFINGTLEFVNPNTQGLPTKMIVDPQKHLDITHDCASVLVMMEESTGICKAGSLVLQFPPIIKPSVDQSILFQNMSDSSSSCLVEHLLLYSLPRSSGGEDKLLLYRASEENKSTDTIGFVSINNDGLKHNISIIPEEWQATDLECVVPFLIASYTLRVVARIRPKDSVLVLPPLDTVSVYIIAILLNDDHEVFTSSWDPEICLMLETSLPKTRILHPKNLLMKLRQVTSGRGVDVCFKSDGSDMDWSLDLVANHGRCIQMGRPSLKDNVGMSVFLRNITLTTSNTAAVIKGQLDMADEDITTSLKTIVSPLIRDRSEDGYPEPRGMGYSLEEQLQFKRPISLQNLFTLLDGPGFRAKDVLDGYPDEDIASVEHLQEKLAIKPQEYSLAQNDLSYLCDSKEQFNMARTSSNLESSRVFTPNTNCSGLLAPPSIKRKCMSVDLSQFTTASTPIIRITVDPASPTKRDPLSSAELKVPRLRTESSCTEDKVFASPTPYRDSTRLAVPKTTDMVFITSPKTPLTPDSPSVKRFLTPSKLTPVLLKLNTCDTDEHPLFIVHPITGTVTLLKNLGEKMKIPCYGIQRTSCTPTSSVSTMAGFYRNAIELQDRTGPYRLAGYSYGGMIAFEIARQMQKSDKQVEFLIILDGGPGYVHSQIAIGRDLLTKSPQHVTGEDVTEIVALMSFIEMYQPIKERDYVQGVLETLPTKYARIRMAVDYIMGSVIISQSVGKTKWLTLRERLLHKDARIESKIGLHSAVTEVIRLSREKKAEEYINSTRLADKYRPREQFAGDIHLLRIKSDPTMSVPIQSDYSLGDLCTGEVKITFVSGDHQSFLKADNVGVVADYIHSILADVKH